MVGEISGGTNVVVAQMPHFIIGGTNVYFIEGGTNVRWDCGTYVWWHL